MRITHRNQIQKQNLNWACIGQRIRQYRVLNNWEIEEAAEQLELTPRGLHNIEISSKTSRKSVNLIFSITRIWNMSINWLLNGEGSPEDEDSPEILPATLIVERGAGIRRSKINDPDGAYDLATTEFIMAIDKFKSVNNIPFPTLSQIYELILALGYRKTCPSRICPLEYKIEGLEKS